MNLIRTPWRYTGCANMNFLSHGFRQLSSDRQTDRQTYRIDRNYKPPTKILHCQSRDSIKRCRKSETIDCPNVMHRSQSVVFKPPMATRYSLKMAGDRMRHNWMETMCKSCSINHILTHLLLNRSRQ